jgi:dCMP deaminase
LEEKQLQKTAKKPDWDEYFLNIAEAVATRADCNRGKIGTVLVRDRRILSTGYNGAPRGLPHCSEVGCLIKKELNNEGQVTERCIRTVHAELNVITQAALHGVSTHDSTLYGIYKPCSVCMKALINAGVRRVVCKRDYHDDLTDKFAAEAGIEIVILNKDQIQGKNIL